MVLSDKWLVISDKFVIERVSQYTSSWVPIDIGMILSSSTIKLIDIL